jgi:DNA-directed RNA polymerase specialized sigma24 family protein
MSAPPAAFPPADPHQHLHQRLADRDPTAPDDFADTFLAALINWLTDHNRGVHPDLVNEAAEEAILAVIRNPGSYHPQDSGLETYLRMSAQADLRNLLSRETTHRSRNERLEVVELSAGSGKYTGREDDPSLGLMIEEELAILAEHVPDSVRAGLTDVEARVLELMLRRERRTAIYADACGVADRPAKEQRRLVKRIKDRLQKRIERQGGP